MEKVYNEVEVSMLVFLVLVKQRFGTIIQPRLVR
jgi:hypothetical protein